jgi:hypothetical protein
VRPISQVEAQSLPAEHQGDLEEYPLAGPGLSTPSSREEIFVTRSSHRPRERLLGVTPFALLVSALAAWLDAIRSINTHSIGYLGLITNLPVVFFLALGCVVGAALLLLSAPRPNLVGLVLCMAVLLLILYGTAPLIYAEPRYGWLYKQVGVVQYINLHGSLNPSIDIYQNWAGYFALAAWFDHIAGLGSPLPYAAWAQLFFESLFCMMLGYATRAKVLRLTWREQWLTVLLFASANWIAQDYLSPQALGFVLSLGVIAIALHWFVTNEPSPRWHRVFRWFQRYRLLVVRRERTGNDLAGDGKSVDSRSRDLVALVLLFVVFAALVVVHELSPYIVAAQLGVLGVLGMLRRRWIPLLMVLMAVGFLAPRFDFVNRKYGLLNSFGTFFLNLQPPAAALHLNRDAALVKDGAVLLSAVVWALAVVGIWRRYRSGRPVLVLAILAFAPFAVGFFQHYGGEMLLRIYLFSLPWSACLAASAMVPLPAESRSIRAVLSPVVFTLCLALFLLTFFGGDSYNVISPSEVAASQYLYGHGQPGPVVYVDADFPSLIGARYNLFRPTLTLLDTGLVTGKMLGSSEVGQIVTMLEDDEHAGQRTGYVVVSKSMVKYAVYDGLARKQDFQRMAAALERSKQLSVFYHNADVTIFQLKNPSK